MQGVAVTLLGVKNRAQVIHGLEVLGVPLDGALVIALGGPEIERLVVGDPDLVQSDGAFRRLAVLVDGFAEHLAGHEDVTPLFRSERRLGRRGGWRIYGRTRFENL